MLLKTYLISRTRKSEKKLIIFFHSNITLFCSSYIIVTLCQLYQSYLIVAPVIILLAYCNFKRKIIILLGVLSSLVGFSLFNHNYIIESKNLFNSSIESNAVIVEDPEFKEFSQEVIVKEQNTNGLILVKLAKYPIAKRGDTVNLDGTLTEPENFSEDFDYNFFLKSKKIFYEIRETSLLKEKALSPEIKFKEEIERFINKNFNYKESNLLKGILIGSTVNFSEEFKTNLRNSGLYHIVSVSGFNFTFIYIAILSLAGLVNRKTLQIIAIPLIISYLILVGVSNIPAVRATIMILISIIVLLGGRKIPSKNILLISVALLLTEYPLYWFNISFILSFAALLGLLLFTNNISSIIKKKFPKIPDTFLEAISSSFGVILSTSIISIIFFESFSLVSLISNVVVLPAIPISMLLGSLLLIMSFFNINIAVDIIGTILDLILKFIILSIETFGQVEAKGTLPILSGILLSLVIFIIIILNDFKNFKEKIKFNN